MSVGGTMWKGHNSSSNGNSRSGMMKGYGMMLFLAFGAALCGVMLLQRFKERRILNLLIKDKDAELLSLHLILQKESMFSKEKAKTIEDMKRKLYSLKNQKMELDRRLEEMQFTVFSLRDEQHIMEAALEEKQNEIQMLREKEKASTEDGPPSTLLNQKEYEIEDSKHHPKNPTNVRSVSTDDSSNHPIYLTAATGHRGMEDDGNNEVTNTRQDYPTEADHANEKLNNQIEAEHSTKGEGENRTRSIVDTREMDAKEASQKQKNSHEDLKDSSTAIEEKIERGRVNGNESFQSVASFELREKKHNTNTTEVIYKEDGDVKAAHDHEHEITTGQEKLKISEGGDGQELGKIYKGENGMRVEASDGYQDVLGYKIKGRHRYGRKTKGKRRRTVAKGRGSQSNEHSDQNAEAARIKTEKSVNDALGNGRHEARGTGQLKKEDGHHHLAITSIGRKEYDQEKLEILKNLEGRREEETGSNDQRTEPDGGKGGNSFMEEPARSAQAEAIKAVGDAGKLKTGGVWKSEGQGANRMRKENGSGIIEVVKNAEQKEAVVKGMEDLNIADPQEMEEDLFDQPSSEMAEGKDE